MVHRKLKTEQEKHLLTLSFGLMIAFFVFGLEAFHFVASTTITLLIVKFVPGEASPWLAFAFNLLYLSYG